MKGPQLQKLGESSIMVLYGGGGGKLNVNESEDVEYCLSFLEWAALVLVVDGVRYLAAGMSTRSSTTLYNRLIWIFDRLDSRVSHCR